LDALPFWQLAAGSVAVLLGAMLVFGLIRSTATGMVIQMVSILGLPTVGFAVYAVAGGPIGRLDLTVLALPFAAMGVAVMLAGLAVRVGWLVRRQPYTFAALKRMLPLGLVAWPCLVVAVSIFVFVFEPAIAVANVALLAAWFAIWIPRASRRYDSVSTYGIAAPPEQVFRFISDPSNWPLYMLGAESAVVNPPGPLAVGSEITIRQRIQYQGLRGPRMLLPESVEFTNVVTPLVPNELLASRRKDLPASWGASELAPKGGGTVVTNRVGNLIAYRYAVVGTRLDLMRNAAMSRAQARERQDALRKLLEQPIAAQ